MGNRDRAAEAETLNRTRTERTDAGCGQKEKSRSHLVCNRLPVRCMIRTLFLVSFLETLSIAAIACKQKVVQLGGSEKNRERHPCTRPKGALSTVCVVLSASPKAYALHSLQPLHDDQIIWYDSMETDNITTHHKLVAGKSSA